MKNYITHLKPGSKKKNHNKWLIAFYEKEDITVAHISYGLIINDELSDLELRIGEDGVSDMTFSSLNAILPNRKIILQVPVFNRSCLNLKRDSFIERIKKQLIGIYVNVLSCIVFIFRIKNKKLNAHEDSLRRFLFNFNKQSDAFRKYAKNDNIDILEIDEYGYASLKLEKDNDLIKKYLNDLGFYSTEFDSDWFFVPKDGSMNINEFNTFIDTPDLYKVLFNPIYKASDSVWGKVNRSLEVFDIIGLIHRGSIRFITKSLSESDIRSRLNAVAKKYKLELAEDHIIS